MRIKVMINALKKYDDNKGVFRHLFGDQEVIQKLKAFSLHRKTKNPTFNLDELYELNDILLSEQTEYGSLSRAVIEELSVHVYGCKLPDNCDRDKLREAFAQLKSAGLFTKEIMQAVVKNAEPNAIAKMIQILREYRLLTKEYFELCLKNDKPAHLALVYGVLNENKLLEFAKHAIALIPYAAELKSLMSFLGKHQVKIGLESIMTNPEVIPSLAELFAMLQNTSKDFFNNKGRSNINLITAVILVAVNDAEKFKNETYQPILETVYQVLCFPAKKHNISYCPTLYKHVDKVQHVCTPSNLEKLLNNVELVDDAMIHAMKEEYQMTRPTDQAGLQKVFDEILSQAKQQKRAPSQSALLVRRAAA